MNGPGDYPLPHPLLASVMHFIPLQVHYQLQTRGYWTLAPKTRGLTPTKYLLLFQRKLISKQN